MRSAEATPTTPEREGAEDADAASNLTAFRLAPALGDLEFFRLVPETPEWVGGGVAGGLGLGFALILGRFKESGICFGFTIFLGGEG